MKNEPERWEQQTWTIPKSVLRLVRNKDSWYFETEGNFDRIPIDDRYYARLHHLSRKIENYHAEEDWIDRHSWQFRWLRFWYRRKKRRESRKSTGTLQST